MSKILEQIGLPYSKEIIKTPYNNMTAKDFFSNNTSEGTNIYYIDKDYEKQIKEYQYMKKLQLVNEISIIINHDEYLDGELSQAEIFMKEAYTADQMDYVIEALMEIYSNNLQNAHALEGILTMISSVSYEAVDPKGPIMAIGLLSNKELIIRDRAIQCFERWNSKKGLDALKSLDCEPKWLQRYVDKVITYIERDGIE